MERKHTSVSSIVINSNALKMLDITINDLSQAEILGKCRITVSIGSDQIPCYNRIDHEIKVKSFKDAFNL